MYISHFPQVPSSPPQSVSGMVKSSTEIAVTWKNVAGPDRNGIVMGFRVYYKAVWELAVDKTEKVQVLNDGNAVAQVLGNLEKDMLYNIRVAAFTSKGDGPKSDIVAVQTDQKGKYSKLLFVELRCPNWR